MPVTPRDQTKLTALTAAVNEIRSPNRFLSRLLYSRTQTLPTEDIEIATFDGGRKTAPFVRRGSEARLVEGLGHRFATVNGPNIRIKMAFTGKSLFDRRPGQMVYVDPNDRDISRAFQQDINRDLAFMESMIVNTEEWLCAQALQQDIVYEVADNDNFRITYPRDSEYNIALLEAESWDNPDPTLPRPLQNIHTVKRLMANSNGINITDAICGRNAADALLELAESGNLKAFKRDSGVRAGSITFVEQFNEDGAIFLGEMGGIRFWEYSRTVEHNGVAVPMIRDDFIEFVGNNTTSDRVMYYAAIPDMEAIEQKTYKTRRLAKSWVTKDPSQRVFLVHTRPLPVNRRPNSTVSMQVTNNSD